MIDGVLHRPHVAERLRDGEVPLQQLEHGLHPWVTFVILPLFALANAGVVVTPELGGLVVLQAPEGTRYTLDIPTNAVSAPTLITARPPITPSEV